MTEGYKMINKEDIKYRCCCGGIVNAISINNKIYSCNIRRCDKCKKQYYSEGILELDFICGYRETDFKEYANLH